MPLNCVLKMNSFLFAFLQIHPYRRQATNLQVRINLQLVSHLMCQQSALHTRIMTSHYYFLSISFASKLPNNHEAGSAI